MIAHLVALTRRAHDAGQQATEQEAEGGQARADDADVEFDA
jgi:hypothetical protein